MEMTELDTFIQSDEGKAWLTRQVQPLADSKAQILAELKTARGREAEAAQRAALAEKLLTDQAAQRAADEAEAKKEQLRALAAKLAADEGISIDPEKYIGPDEETTRTLVSAEAARFKQYADAVLEAKFGNVGKPMAGASATPPALSFDAFENLDAGGRMAFMRQGGTLT